MKRLSLEEIFRLLVVGSALCYTIYFLSPWIVGDSISQDAYDALSWNGASAILQIPLSISWLLFLVWIAITVGMFYFSRAARMVFVYLIVFEVCLTLLGGIKSLMAFEAYLFYVSSLMDGAIIAMAYCSPLKARFEAKEIVQSGRRD